MLSSAVRSEIYCRQYTVFGTKVNDFFNKKKKDRERERRKQLDLVQMCLSKSHEDFDSDFCNTKAIDTVNLNISAL